MKTNKPELLAPAGSLNKLKTAFIYGADAAYIGGEEFSLREAAENFSIAEIKEGLDFAHKLNKKVYLTANIILHNDDLKQFRDYINEIKNFGFDGIIISDLGALNIVKDVAPDLEIHISTQANNLNYASANMWHTLGAKRIVLARDLTGNEIKQIRQNIPDDIELEMFVHGAMCISYSGRCLLSNFMTNRDSNRGACSHPCRWKYYLMEEKRPGEYMPVYENDRGSFIFNSKDLCLVNHIDEIIKMGVNSFKVEGRVKTEYYVAVVMQVYRDAIDTYFKDPENFKVNPYWMEELKKISHRHYSTGFYLGKTTSDNQVYETSSYIREYDLIGTVKDYDSESGMLIIEQRNKFSVGETIEIMQPGEKFIEYTIEKMYDADDNEIESAPHAQMTVKLPVDREISLDAILRKKKNS